MIVGFAVAALAVAFVGLALEKVPTGDSKTHGVHKEIREGRFVAGRVGAPPGTYSTVLRYEGVFLRTCLRTCVPAFFFTCGNRANRLPSQRYAAPFFSALTYSKLFCQSVPPERSRVSPAYGSVRVGQ